MRQFDFYEFAGVIVPGATLLTGIAFCNDEIKEVIFEQNLSIGEAALSVIVAYGLGHLLPGALNIEHLHPAA